MGDAEISANLDEAAGQDWEGSADLRQYVMVLVSWWREMALLVLLGALLAGAAVWAAKTFWPSYEASADVLIVEPETEAALDIAFLKGTAVQRLSQAKQATFLGLVRGGDLAVAVAERMGLSQDAFPDASLLAAISAQLVAADAASGAESNLIRITASLGSPKDAQALANAWTEEYVKKIDLERERTAQSILDALERAFEQAASSHETAQAQLEGALAQSRFGQLQRQIAANEQRIAALHELAGQTEQLEEETRQLSSAKEREGARLALLVQARDSALSALAALRSKHAELRLKFATETSRVRLASRAVAPSNPQGLSATLVGATAGVILTPLAIFLAFCANALGLKPPLNRGKAFSPTR